MKKLFFTTTSPRHPYKSEKFFYLFQRLRYFNFFGKNRANNRKTLYKRMLILRRFFGWYYSFLGNKQLKRFFRKISLYNREHIGIFYKFINLLELHIQVVLVRAQFITNLKLAKTVINSRQILLNGRYIHSSNIFLKKGDIIELIFWQLWASLRELLRNYYFLQKLKKKFFFCIRQLNIFYALKTKRKSYKKIRKLNRNA